MRKRFRKLVDSLLYAGLIPSGAQAASGSRRKWLGPLRGPVERFLSGGPAPSDPFYLTNRTFGQRLRQWVLIGVPCLLLIGGVAVGLSNIFLGPKIAPRKELSAAEIARKILPSLDTGGISSNQDIELVEVHIDKGVGISVAGTLKSKSRRAIHTAELIFNLTDAVGSQLGAVGVTVKDVEPGATVQFRFPIESTTAAFALLREAHTQ
jgi:hypothetical protein